MNLANQTPTKSLQTLLYEHYVAKNLGTPPVLGLEEATASILNALEEVMNKIDAEGPEYFLKEYTKYWSHRWVDAFLFYMQE